MTKQRTPDEPTQARALIQPVKRASLLQRLRTNFLTGIVVVAPFGITAYITWTIVDYVDSQVLPQVLPLIPEAYRPENVLPFSVPGLGLVIMILFIIATGSLMKNFFGREILRIGERWVDRMPVVRSIYNALKQIAETIFTQSQNSFEKACIVEYPRRGIWAVAFVSTATKGEVPQKAVDGREMMSVFLPTTPNPTSGFLLFVPKEDVIFLDMTVEEAAKLVISAGLVTPPSATDAPALDDGPGDDLDGGDGRRVIAQRDDVDAAAISAAETSRAARDVDGAAAESAAAMSTPIERQRDLSNALPERAAAAGEAAAPRPVARN